jgi:hypothetical protein
MALEDIEELKRDAKSLAKFYSKDFGHFLCEIHWIGQVYLHEPTPERKQGMEEHLDVINAFYKTIPFEELTEDERYAPLLVVNRLLPEVKAEMEEFFADPSENTYNDLFLACNAIHQVGYLYRKSFHESLDKVHEHPEGKGFKVKLVGITGKEWNY